LRFGVLAQPFGGHAADRPRTDEEPEIELIITGLDRLCKSTQ